jgi:two-component system response regulator HydG
MALEMQAKLLRVLQDRRVRPVGGDTEVSFDTRIVAATNRDLDADVAAGRFREDLFYRINVVRIHVPPLRSRGNDILLLAQQFLQELAGRSGKAVTGISGTTAERLLTYDWPGNVRELQNCMERAVTLARFEELTPDDLPEKIRLHASTRLSEGDDPEQLPTLDEMERRYIRRVLSATEGNKTRAARVLGVDRRTLYRRIHRLGIDDPGSAS